MKLISKPFHLACDIHTTQINNCGSNQTLGLYPNMENVIILEKKSTYSSPPQAAVTLPPVTLVSGSRLLRALTSFFEFFTHNAVIDEFY